MFFVNSGTEANEAAIKFARKTISDRVASDKTLSNPLSLPLKGFGKPTEIVAFKGGFHGRTIGSLSVTHKVSLFFLEHTLRTRLEQNPDLCGCFIDRKASESRLSRSCPAHDSVNSII